MDQVLSAQISIPSFLNVKYYNAFNNLIDVKIKNYKLGLPNCHQGIVFENKSIKYSLDYKIASDYDFYLNHGYIKLQMMKTPGYVYYDNEGFSKSNLIERDQEIENIISQHFGMFYVVLFRVIVIAKNIVRKYIR